MNRSTSNNYNYLFRYIIVGDMGMDNINLSQLLENPVYYSSLQITNSDINTS